MIWALLIGCSLGLRNGDDTGPEIVDDDDRVAWSLQPTEVALGETPLDQPITTSITLVNSGNVDLLVLDLGDDDLETLEVSMSDAPMLAPGATTQLDFTWTPSEPGELITSVPIQLGSSPEDPQIVDVPVDGTALGAVATLSTSTYDFGEVGIGCEDELTLTITNTGNLEMEITEVALHGADGYRISDDDELPWTIGPFQSQEQVVYFSPDDLGIALTELEFVTDQGTIIAEFQGDGVVDEEKTISFDVGEQSRTTIIWDVNLTAIPNSTEDQYSTFFVDALPTFFETLEDNNASYRAGFVWSVSGTIDGDYDYIDDSFTPSEATSAALEMIAPGATGGDNDQNFTTLLAAVRENQDWLSEDSGWAESKLSLITVQRDTEASGGSWSNWVSQTQAYKDDKEDLVYHAIAGPVPGGCGSAEPFRDYDQAVTSTGGEFHSVCLPDWNEAMAQLAAACMEGVEGLFKLEGTPMEESIEVSVDSVPQADGWTYDSELNAVKFDEGAYPPFESMVEIYYWMSGSCG